jgi:hypothetical protein
VPGLCRLIGDIPGTDLVGLLAALAPDPAAANQALRDLITQVQAWAMAVAPPESAVVPPETTPAPPESAPVPPA